MNSELMTPSISRYRSNLSMASEKRSMKDRSMVLDSKSVRGYPSDSETMVRFRKNQKEQEFDEWNTTYRIYF